MHLFTGMSSFPGDMRPCRDLSRRRDLDARVLGWSGTNVDHTPPIKPCVTWAGNATGHVGGVHGNFNQMSLRDSLAVAPRCASLRSYHERPFALAAADVELCCRVLLPP